MKDEATNREIMTAVQEVSRRIEVMSNSISDHEKRFNSHDVLHKQITLTQEHMVNDLITLKSGEIVNSTYRIQAQASINTIKYLLGFVGLANIIILLKTFNVVN